MCITLDPGLKLQIGEHSYIHDRQIRNPSGALTEITIGKFCSIATELTIIGYDHHAEWITTYPFLDDGHRANWSGTQGIPYPQAKEFGSNISRGNIQIGNDVWIGYNVKLFKGITIGDGAVVGACSLVNKSVDPYTIVAGIPARPLRKRFSEAEIKLLELARWWDWPPELINQYMPILCSSNLGALEQAMAEVQQVLSAAANPKSLLRHFPAPQDGFSTSAPSSAEDAASRAEAEQWVAQADAHYANGDLAAAASALKQALQLNPDEVALLTCHGNILFQLGQHAEALAQFQRAAERDPENGDIQVRLASAASCCGDQPVFQTALQRALLLAPLSPVAHKLAAHEYFRAQDFPAAAEYFCALLSLNPEDTQVLLQLGRCLEEIKDTLSARWCYERTLELDPDAKAAQEALARLVPADGQPLTAIPQPVPA